LILGFGFEAGAFVLVGSTAAVPFFEILQLIYTNQIKSNQIKSNQIKSNQIKSNQIKSTAFPFLCIFP
jgi:hypothetical protein